MSGDQKQGRVNTLDTQMACSAGLAKEALDRDAHTHGLSIAYKTNPDDIHIHTQQARRGNTTLQRACTWCALQMRSRSCRLRKDATTSGPKVKDTPRSFSPHPTISFSGSDHSRSHSRPERTPTWATHRHGSEGERQETAHTCPMRHKLAPSANLGHTPYKGCVAGTGRGEVCVVGREGGGVHQF